MIKAKINKDTLNIPTFKELTILQYKNLIATDNPTITDYLKITTGKNFTKILRSENLNLDHLTALIGKEPILKFRNSIVVDKIYKIKKTDEIKTLGQRLMISEYAKTNTNNIDIALFILSIILTKSYDFDTVKEFQKKLYKLSYYEILPNANFFLNSFKIGNKKGMNFLKKLIAFILINIKEKKSRQEWGDLKSMGQLAKS